MLKANGTQVNGGRVSKANQRVDKALDMFKKVQDSIETANSELVAVIEQERNRITESEKVIDRAEEALKVNQSLNAKVSNFVPKSE